MQPEELRAKPEELRAKAQKCLQLAREGLDPIVREGLIELASDYERRAERLEGEQRAATKVT